MAVGEGCRILRGVSVRKEIDAAFAEGAEGAEKRRALARRPALQFRGTSVAKRNRRGVREDQGARLGRRPLQLAARGMRAELDEESSY